MHAIKTKKALAPGDETLDSAPQQNVSTITGGVYVADVQVVPAAVTRSRRVHQPANTGARPEYLAFALALRQAMLDKKLSASEVARRVWGISKDKRGYEVARNRDRIGHYLAGTSYPEPENLTKLAEAIGVGVEDLAIESRPRPAAREPRGIAGQAADLQVTALPGQPDKLYIQVSRVLSWDTATRIMQLIREDERKAPPMPPSGRSFGKPEPELREIPVAAAAE